MREWSHCDPDLSSRLGVVPVIAVAAASDHHAARHMHPISEAHAIQSRIRFVGMDRPLAAAQLTVAEAFVLID